MRHLIAFRPLEILAIDFVKFDQGTGGYENVLVMTDVHTKFPKPCHEKISSPSQLLACSETTGSQNLGSPVTYIAIKDKTLKGI